MENQDREGKVLKGKRKNVFGIAAAGLLGFGLLAAWLATGGNDMA